MGTEGISCRHISTSNHRGYEALSYYLDNGFMPEDKSGSSVSQMLEYACDDWCIAHAAKKLGRTEIYNTLRTTWWPTCITEWTSRERRKPAYGRYNVSGHAKTTPE